jgi:hypothetical protein
MGIRGHLRQVTPNPFDRLRRNPESVEELVHGKGPAEPGELLAVLQRTQKIALDARAAGVINDPTEKERIRAQILKELAGSRCQGWRRRRSRPD